MSQRNLFPKGALPRGLQAGFDAFWAAYPPRRPNPRAMAEMAFARAVRDGAAPGDLVRAAEAYAAELRERGIGSEFIVHASTFLRQRRYEDYLRAPIAEAPARAAPAADIDHPLWPLLRGRLSETDFRHWIEPLRCVSIVAGAHAVLMAPNRFYRDWVRQHFDLALKAGLGVRILDIEIAEDLRA
ncbi:hypothetical protein GXW74_15700 [Roseomonas eburnea]|uniref:DnaA N-terminal domain-containing protein n=1 Tax=Neoroseomonas eburnea TaxID=1346889 RepID=A0A9X9XE03_9PROT|nr:DnaA N-terminal domain-containing protein [Neoroseomonas eburnea]MBR0681939.1 hypothetical protein [Neoroseomonas eburnea]